MLVLWFLWHCFFGLPAAASQCSGTHSAPIRTSVECRIAGIPKNPTVVTAEHHCEEKAGRATLVCQARCRGALKKTSEVPVCSENPTRLKYLGGCEKFPLTEFVVRREHPGAMDCVSGKLFVQDSPEVACGKLHEDASSLCPQKGEMQQVYSNDGTQGAYDEPLCCLGG